jgi:hypothetical protein
VPRIRTIKPEFWDSPGTARASLRARLFFISLWNWADDWGVGTANPKQLIGFAFPNDDDVTVAEFPHLRTEVAECYGVQWYEVENRPYYAIPSWDDHQKNERRANRRNPTPDQGIPTDTEMHGDSAPTRGDSALGTGEQGNRGTGEQGKQVSAPAVLASAFEAAWSHWPKKVDRKQAEARFATAARRIDIAELVNHIIRFGDAYRDTTEKQFIPALGTWLNRDRWNDELPQSRDTKQSRADENAADYYRYYGGNDERAGSVPALDPGVG